LNCGRAKKAAQYLQKVEKKIDQARMLERSYYHVVKTLAALLTDNLTAADRHQHSALEMAEKISMPSYSTWCWYGSALTAVFQGNYRQALTRIEQVFDLAASPGNPWFTCQAHLCLAYMYDCKGHRQQAVQQLKHGFTLARRNNYLTFFFFIPRMMSELAVLALEEDIEPHFVRRFIRRRRLQPEQPPLHLANWPWPIKIYTLGRFAILHNGKKLPPSSQSKKKPVMLLQALIAFGGRQVSKTRLAGIFWPDSDGDEQAASLKITLHRLRQLLGIREAVLQSADHLSLNPSLCWVDSWQFERLANETLIAENLTEEERDFVAGKAMGLYHGLFLDTYRDEAWTYDLQKKLDNMFLQLRQQQRQRRKKLAKQEKGEKQAGAID
jgi:hypothetical protein